MTLAALILTAGLTQLSLSSTTYIYKWVDDKGVTHYSQDEPEGVVAERIDAQTLQPKKIGSVSPTKKSAVKTSIEVRDKGADTLQSQKLCEKATHNLNLLKTHTRILKQTDPSKEPVALTEEERQLSITRNQKQIETHCKY